MGFGGQGVIAENVRDEQRKFIKYNHLVANLLSFHTLVTMTRALQQLLQEGGTVNIDALSALSPYRTEHINRFGNYVIDFTRMPEPLESNLGLSLAATLNVIRRSVCFIRESLPPSYFELSLDETSL